MSAYHRGMEKRSAFLSSGSICFTSWPLFTPIGRDKLSPLHLSMDCQRLLSQVNFTDPTSMRQCYSWCRAKSCETPQGLLPSLCFQGALNFSSLKNGCRRKHLPAMCLPLVASFFSSSGMCCQKERAWQSKLSSATDYIASV